MNIKKPLITAVLGLSVVCFGVTSNASAEELNKDTQPVLVDSDTVQGLKSSSNPGLNTLAAPNNSSTVNVYTQFLGNPYAIARSKSTTNEDYIYAKCRAVKKDGTVINTRSDSKNRASYVEATATNTSTYYGSDYAIGNHTYKLSGYNDVNHETRAYW